MPYRQDTPDTLTLWPYRSLGQRGFVWFIGVTAALFMVPLSAQIGTAALWVMLPFLAGAVAAVWFAIRHSQRVETEVLSLTADEVTLTRHRPGKPDLNWSANPHWVRPALHGSGGPVPDYLTLSGGGRTVELGAFLTRDERRALYLLLTDRLDALRSPER